MTTDQLIARGRECLEQNDYVGAIAALREAAERAPDYADIRQLLGVSLGLAGQPEAAIDEFDRALSLNPSYVEAHLNKAITLNEMGRYEEARDAFRRAWESDHPAGRPFSRSESARLANLHMELGEVYAELGAHGDAVAQYRTAMRLRPDFLDIRNKLAEALMEQGDLQGCLQELEHLLEQNPNYMEARLHLGLAYYRLGLKERAAAEWHACLEREASHPRARAYLHLLRGDGGGDREAG